MKKMNLTPLAAIRLSCLLLLIAKFSNGKDPEIEINRSDLAVMDSRIHESIEDAGILVDAPQVAEYLSSVAMRCTKLSSDNRFYIINTSESNCFSLSNGTVYISLGMLGLIDNETQLAFLLTHELAHVTLDHYRLSRYEEIKRTQSKSTIDVPYYLRVGLCGFSDKMEERADSCALAGLKSAGYNAWEAKGFLTTMYRWLKCRERSIERKYARYPKLADRYYVCKKRLLDWQYDTSSGECGDREYGEMVKPFLPRIIKQLLRSPYSNELVFFASRKISKYPECPQWRYFHGLLLETYYPADSFKVAFRSLNDAYTMDTTATVALRDLGWLFFKNNQPDSARAYLSDYLFRTPGAADSSSVLFYLSGNHE